MFAGLGLLILMTMRGINIIIAALISSAVVALFGGLQLETAMAQHYMEGFTAYFKDRFLIFLYSIY